MGFESPYRTRLASPFPACCLTLVRFPQDLLDTLKVCAATEVSLAAKGSVNGSAKTAAAAVAPYRETAASPQRRALPHQQKQRPRGVDARLEDGARHDREVGGLKKNPTCDGDSEGDSDGDEDGTAITGREEGCADDADVDETPQTKDAEGERASATPGDGSGCRGTQATPTTARATAAAVGARAQELAAARFAGMRSAAQAKSAAAAAAAAASASGDDTPSSGDSSVPGVAPSFAKGVYNIKPQFQNRSGSFNAGGMRFWRGTEGRRMFSVVVAPNEDIWDTFWWSDTRLWRFVCRVGSTAVLLYCWR